MNFAEIFQPAQNPPSLPPLTTYVAALKKMGITGAALPPVPALEDQPGAVCESSVCLLLALQQSRSGLRFSPDSLATGAVATATQHYVAATPKVVQAKQLVDTWGKPLAFYRWPTKNEELNPGKAPTPGQHSDEVLAGVLGYDAERIARLRKSGALG